MLAIQKIINFLKANLKVFLIIFLVIACITMVSLLVDNYKISRANVEKPEVIKKEGYRANYSGDLKFLGCLSEQHRCLYRNIEDQIEYSKILENCYAEDYCASNNSKF